MTWSKINEILKVGLSPSKKLLCLLQTPLKMMTNVFYFIVYKP